MRDTLPCLKRINHDFVIFLTRIVRFPLIFLFLGIVHLLDVGGGSLGAPSAYPQIRNRFYRGVRRNAHVARGGTHKKDNSI